MVSLPRKIENFFPYLEKISIRKCNLTSITRMDLENFKLLREIDLSFNKLNRLDNNVFECNHDLESINLDNNQLGSIDEKAFSYLKRLKAFSAVNNVRSFKIETPTSMVHAKLPNDDPITFYLTTNNAFDDQLFNPLPPKKQTQSRKYEGNMKK
jgi:hypothetical protein